MTCRACGSVCSVWRSRARATCLTHRRLRWRGCCPTGGARLCGYDPACAQWSEVVRIRSIADPNLAAEDADVLVLLTDWAEFALLDWAQISEVMRTLVLVDARNQLDPRAHARWDDMARNQPHAAVMRSMGP